MGLDKPLPVQFWDYLVKLSHGDMGRSWRTGQPVSKDLLQRLPATLELAVAATVLAVVVGHVLGLMAAIHQNSLLDQVVRLFAILGASTAIFWLALVFIYLLLLPVGLGRSPVGSAGRRHRSADAADRVLHSGQSSDG